MESAEVKPTATAIFSLFNLGCSECSGSVKRKLKKLAGIKTVTVNHATDTVLVNYDPRRVTTSDIRAFLMKLSYDTDRRQS